MWSKCLFFVCAVIAHKYGKGTQIFGIIGVMAKIPYGYCSGYPCLVGVAGPNVAGVSIIKAEKTLSSFVQPKSRCGKQME